MTTSNQIIAEVILDVVFIPIECLHNLGDTLTFVYKKSTLAIVRQEVKVGKSNEDQIIVLDGIEENDRIYLSLPTEEQEKELVLLSPSEYKLSSSQ